MLDNENGVPGVRRSPTVAVVDSGWYAKRQDERVRDGVGFVGDSEVSLAPRDTTDAVGHGTKVASIILAVCPIATVTPLKVFDKTLETSVDAVLEALRWSLQHDVDIVNLSLTTDLARARRPLFEACQELQEAGIAVIAAASNRTHGGFPAEFANAIGVAIEVDQELAPLRLRVDRPVEFWMSRGWIGAPLKRGLFPRITTSSFATAFVSGLALRIVERQGRLPLADLRQLIFDESIILPNAAEPK